MSKTPGKWDETTSKYVGGGASVVTAHEVEAGRKRAVLALEAINKRDVICHELGAVSLIVALVEGGVDVLKCDVVFEEFFSADSGDLHMVALASVESPHFDGKREFATAVITTYYDGLDLTREVCLTKRASIVQEIKALAALSGADPFKVEGIDDWMLDASGG